MRRVAASEVPPDKGDFAVDLQLSRRSTGDDVKKLTDVMSRI